jgi:hypothetical protein
MIIIREQDDISITSQDDMSLNSMQRMELNLRMMTESIKKGLKSSYGRSMVLFLLLGFLLTACGSGASLDSQDDQAGSPEPTLMIATETPVPTTPTFTPTTELTASPQPTLTPTQVPRISVSENTNCRSGPGTEYLFKGVLTIGEYAEVIARSGDSEYWYITIPDIPDEGCWLWGEYASVEGVIDTIPVITPAPSPTPLAGFEVYVKSYVECTYAKMIVFAVRNAGSQRIWSGYIDVQDLGTGGSLYKALRRHPFADTVKPACPPGHGNELYPGETRYIHVPVPLDKSGIQGVGIITLCTADHLGGTCMTEYSYFVLP